MMKCAPSSGSLALPHIFARGEEAKAITGRKPGSGRGAGWSTRAWLDESLSPNTCSLGELPGTFMAMSRFICGIIVWRAMGLLEWVLVHVLTGRSRFFTGGRFSGFSDFAGSGMAANPE
jgi:hypothetical protein